MILRLRKTWVTPAVILGLLLGGATGTLGVNIGLPMWFAFLANVILAVPVGLKVRDSLA